MAIRPTRHSDITDLQKVLDQTDLFPPQMLPDMLAGFLGSADSPDLWLTCDVDGAAVGFCYATPEALTDGTWNMLAIAVLPAVQGLGHGGAIVQHLEDQLRQQGHRILIADTSGTDDFADTRSFYEQQGYTFVARIRDFWPPDDDKVTFRKALQDI